MSALIKRINPQRLFANTAHNIKRILVQSPVVVQHTAQQKPLRMTKLPQQWLLVVAHSDGGLLDDHAQQTIAGAAILANAVTGVAVLVLGQLYENLSRLGADEVQVLPELDWTKFDPAAELAALEKAIAQYQPRHIFMPDNALGDGDLGRRLAAKTQKNVATHVIELSREHVATYEQGGALIVSTSLPAIILLAQNVVDTQLPFIGKAVIKPAPELMPEFSQQTLALDYSLGYHAYKDLGINAAEAGQTALEEADCVVAAGNGVANISSISKLAKLLNAAVGASRVAVDDGKFNRQQQVGATGKTVTASTYFAIGISGAVQHLQGIKECRHVIAINKDASAPIVKRANLSLIGDAEDIMQHLILAIEQAKKMAKNIA